MYFSKSCHRALLPGLAKAAALAAIAGGAAFLSQPAEAWWHGGVFIGVPPVVVGPPVPAYPYYYPPAYYPPAYYPPAYYPYAYPAPAASAQPAQTPMPQSESRSSQVAYGSMCNAGVYRCAAPAQTPLGSTCSCPGLGAPSYGSVQ